MFMPQHQVSLLAIESVSKIGWQNDLRIEKADNHWACTGSLANPLTALAVPERPKAQTKSMLADYQHEQAKK